MSDSEKRRASNFTSTEESLLISLINKYKHVIENKKSDTEANFKKHEYWLIIEKEFNNLSGASFREAKVLKKKYDNLKKRTKKKFADEKCYKMGTGGGPSREVDITSTDVEIKEILGCRVEGLVSQFGGDACTIETQSDDIEMNDVECTNFVDHDYFEIPSEIQEFEDLPNIDRTQANIEIEVLDDIGNKVPDWSKYTPSKLKTSKSKPLMVQKKGQSQKMDQFDSRVAQWAEAKAALESDKQKCLQEEHLLKLKCFQEKHEEELRLMRVESEIRIRCAKEEHEKK